jgi:hypothetical protein
MLVAAAGLLVACDPLFTPEPPDFVARVERPDDDPLFREEVDGVEAEVYEVDDCALLVVIVPGFGEFSEEACDPPPSSEALISSAECAAVEDGFCVHGIPVFTVGSTLPEAASVCIQVKEPGHPPGELVPVRSGWWFVTAGSLGGDMYPLNGDGNRLDALDNEIDDRVAAACGLRP